MEVRAGTIDFGNPRNSDDISARIKEFEDEKRKIADAAADLEKELGVGKHKPKGIQDAGAEGRKVAGNGKGVDKDDVMAAIKGAMADGAFAALMRQAVAGGFKESLSN